MYKSNEKHCSIFFRLIVCSSLFRLIIVLFFHVNKIASILTWTCDQFEFQSLEKLSQLDAVVPMRLIFNLFAIFVDWGNGICFFSMGIPVFIKYLNFPSKISRNCLNTVVVVNFPWRHDRFLEMSTRLTSLFTSFCKIDSRLFITTALVFSNNLLSGRFCSCFGNVFLTKTIFWQRVSGQVWRQTTAGKWGSFPPSKTRISFPIMFPKIDLTLN